MISIVIIGKNEADNLPNLYQSLCNVHLEKEILYIDSASTDNSVEISKKFCDKVCLIENSSQLCASAGRYVGTQEAQYDWILYLDGDMELETEFIDFLNSTDFLNYDSAIAGFIGYYTYLYNDLSSDTNRLLQPKNKIVPHFGGAVLLNKEVTLQAGNWNPSVIANEEIDLYVRIQNLGYSVFGLDKKMVKHIAKKVSNLDTLFELFWPKNNRYFGFGQVLVSQYKHQSLVKFIQIKPYSFVLLFLLIASFFLKTAIVLLSLFFIYVTLHKKWHYNLVYLSEIFRGFAGIFQYKKYEPKYTIFQKGSE